MAVRRKPNTVEEFINAGGSVGNTSDAATEATYTSPAAIEEVPVEEEVIAVTLRIPKDLLAEVDTAAKSRRPRFSRNSWILESLIEKLEQERQNKSA